MNGSMTQTAITLRRWTLNRWPRSRTRLDMTTMCVCQQRLCFVYLTTLDLGRYFMHGSMTPVCTSAPFSTNMPSVSQNQPWILGETDLVGSNRLRQNMPAATPEAGYGRHQVSKHALSFPTPCTLNPNSFPFPLIPESQFLFPFPSSMNPDSLSLFPNP